MNTKSAALMTLYRQMTMWQWIAAGSVAVAFVAMVYASTLQVQVRACGL